MPLKRDVMVGFRGGCAGLRGSLDTVLLAVAPFLSSPFADAPFAGSGSEKPSDCDSVGLPFCFVCGVVFFGDVAESATFVVEDALLSECARVIVTGEIVDCMGAS